jgi:hypothetical protein
MGALCANDMDQLDNLMKQSLAKGENEPYVMITNGRLFKSNCNNEESDFFDDYLRLIG